MYDENGVLVLFLVYPEINDLINYKVKQGISYQDIVTEIVNIARENKKRIKENAKK